MQKWAYVIIIQKSKYKIRQSYSYCSSIAEAHFKLKVSSLTYAQLSINISHSRNLWEYKSKGFEGLIV